MGTHLYYVSNLDSSTRYAWDHDVANFFLRYSISVCPFLSYTYNSFRTVYYVGVHNPKKGPTEKIEVKN